MAKTEVYSWRLSAATKATLEAEARREGTSVGSLLERITQDWVQRRRPSLDDATEQARLHKRVMKLAGTIHGGLPPSTSVRDVVRERIRRRHGR